MGLMNRILSQSGAVAGDGLLKRALELRRAAQKKADDPVMVHEMAGHTASPMQVDAEKKKPLRPFWKRAA